MSSAHGRNGHGSLATRATVAMIVVLVVTAACAGDPTQSEEYTSLEAELATVTAELADAQSRLVGSEAALASSRQSFTDTESELEDTAAALVATEARIEALEGAVESMLDRLDMIRDAAAAHVTGDLFISVEGYSAAAGAGVATEVGDSLVATLDLPGGSWEGFITDPGWFWCWCEQVDELGDPGASAALDRWFDTPIGSEEEWWAWYEVQMRIMSVLVEEVDEAADEGGTVLDDTPIVTTK